MNGKLWLFFILALVGTGVIGLYMGKSLSSKNLDSLQPVSKAALGELKTATPTKESVETSKNTSTPLQVTPVRVVEQESMIRLTGSLGADEKSDVASNVSGIAKEVPIERGSMVEKGDVLVRLDAVDAKNMLAEGQAGVEELKAALGMIDEKSYQVEDQPGVKVAKAALDLAELNYKRYTELYGQKAISKASFDQMQTEYDSAQQRHQQALYQARQLFQSYKTALTKITVLKKALDDTVIKSPFAGLVAEKFVSVGERVSSNGAGSGSKVCTIVKIDPLRLLLTVPQQYAGVVQEGQSVSFKVDSVPDRTFTGEVKFLSPNVESNSRSLTIEAVVPNVDHVLRPGFFASAELSLPEKEKRFYLPTSAVIRNGDTTKIFVARDGKAHEQVVSVGNVEGNEIQILTGVTASDNVVVIPLNIHDGDRIS